MKKRLFSLLLCLALACGLPCVTALADAENEPEQLMELIEIELYEPVAGDASSGFQFKDKKFEQAKNKSYSWTPSLSYFEAGEVYRLTIRTDAPKGWYFSDKTKVTFNGKPAVVSEQKEHSIVFYRDYVAQGKKIGSVAITVEEPIAGKRPAKAGLSAEGVEDFWSQWYDPRDIDRGIFVYEEGQNYRLEYEVRSESGYSFAKDAVVTVNGAKSNITYQDVGEISGSVSYQAKRIDGLCGITVEEPPIRTAIFNNDVYPFDTTGMVLRAHYTDRDDALITDGTNWEAFIGLADNSDYAQAVYVSYTEDGLTAFTELPSVRIWPGKNKKLSGVEITTPPAKTEYTAGESFDPAGMVVTATYKTVDIKEKTIDVITPIGDYKFSPSGALSESDTSVNVSYTEGNVTKTAAQAITVKPKAQAEPEQPQTEPEKPPTEPEKPQTEPEKPQTEPEKPQTEPEKPQTEPEKPQNPFTDVSESDLCYDAVLWAYYHEPQVTNGIGNRQFGPGSTVTRGQAMTFLWRAYGSPEPNMLLNPFTDIKESDYWYKPILWAVEKGIANGTGNGLYSPNQTCSCAHIVTFLYRAAGEPGKTGAGAWYADAVHWASEVRGLTAGSSEPFRPEADCPRSDVVLYLYRQLAK